MKTIKIEIDETGKVSIDGHAAEACAVAQAMGQALGLDKGKEKRKSYKAQTQTTQTCGS
jgi:hypothetical protein